MNLYDKADYNNRPLQILIHSVMTRPDNCSFINGEYLKSGLEKLENWCLETNDEVFP